MQELRIGVVDGALPIRGDRGREVGEYPAEPIDRRHLRIERDGRSHRETGQIDACRRSTLRQGVGLTLTASNPSERLDAAERRLAVAGYLVDLDRCFAAFDVGPVDDSNVFVQVRNDHDLAGRVLPHSSGSSRAQPDLRQQDAHVDQGCDAGSDQPGREIASDTGHLGDHEVSGGGSLAGQLDLDMVRLVQLQPQTSAMQPAVERVEHRRCQFPLRTEHESELDERLQRGARVASELEGGHSHHRRT